MSKQSDALHLSPELADQIMHITDAQMDELLPLVIRRCNQLRSDTEMLFFFMPTDPKKRAKSFSQIVHSLRARYNIPEKDEIP